MVLVDANGATLVNNSIVGGSVGIQVDSAIGTVTIDSNNISGATTGIEALSSTQLITNGNTIDGPTTAVRYFGTAGSISSNTITNATTGVSLEVNYGSDATPATAADDLESAPSMNSNSIQATTPVVGDDTAPSNLYTDFFSSNTLTPGGSVAAEIGFRALIYAFEEETDQPTSSSLTLDDSGGMFLGNDTTNAQGFTSLVTDYSTSPATSWAEIQTFYDATGIPQFFTPPLTITGVAGERTGGVVAFPDGTTNNLPPGGAFLARSIRAPGSDTPSSTFRFRLGTPHPPSHSHLPSQAPSS